MFSAVAALTFSLSKQLDVLRLDNTHPGASTQGTVFAFAAGYRVS